MTPGGRYNQLELRCRAGDFALDFEAEWDPPAAALFGPSGSGKSTILEIIAGVRRGASGRVVLDGRTILDTERGIEPAARDRWIGWVPQDASLFPHLTVRENVRFGLSRGGPEGERRLAASVALLELEPLLERPAVALSGGERQRAAVARAIASGARVLLLDEPLASLDVPCAPGSSPCSCGCATSSACPCSTSPTTPRRSSRSPRTSWSSSRGAAWPPAARRRCSG